MEHFMDIDVSNRHESTKNIIRFLSGGGQHLPDEVRDIWNYTEVYVSDLLDALPDGREFTVGLRKLLEAKDCFIRHALTSRNVIDEKEAD